MANYDEIIAHFPQTVSKAIVDYATEVAFKWSRYLFTWREGKQQYGYCTHCNNEYQTKGLKHNENSICPKCQSLCRVKSSGRGRKYLIDEVYFVYYEKSVINPQAITARGIYAVRDYRFNFREVETLFETKALYVFEPGGSKMLHRPWLYYSWMGSEMSWRSNWEVGKKIYSFFDNSCMANKPCYCSHDSIAEAVKGTPFQYSTFESYLVGDMVKFFDLYAKYPCVEYLTKMGLNVVVEAKLNGSQTYSAINWRGKNIQSVLKLNKQEIKELINFKTNVGPLFLKLYQISLKQKPCLSFNEIYEIIIEYGSYFDDVKALLKRTTLAKIHGFIKKQFNNKNKKHYCSMPEVLHTWRDYISDCGELGMDLREERVLFPSNLYQAHQNTIKQIKVKEDKELNQKIASRVKSLSKFCFEAYGLSIRPAFDSIELIEEGKSLHHCVGTYAKRYAEGVTDLFVIRKIDSMDKPFYTMEIKNNEIVQTRGLGNCLPDKKVQKFIDAFTAEKLEKKRVKVKAKIPEREVIAV